MGGGSRGFYFVEFRHLHVNGLFGVLVASNKAQHLFIRVMLVRDWKSLQLDRCHRSEKL
jgi:hypothetical protein